MKFINFKYWYLKDRIFVQAMPLAILAPTNVKLDEHRAPDTLQHIHTTNKLTTDPHYW